MGAVLSESPSATSFLHTSHCSVFAQVWIPCSRAYSWWDLSTGCLSPKQQWIIPFSLRVLLLLQVTPQRAKGDAFSFWDVSCRQHWPGFITSKLTNSCWVSLPAPSPPGIDEHRKSLTAAHPQTDIMGMNSLSLTQRNILLNVTQSSAECLQVLILHPCQSLRVVLSLSPAPLGFLVNNYRIAGWKRPM